MCLVQTLGPVLSQTISHAHVCMIFLEQTANLNKEQGGFVIHCSTR